MPTYKLCYFNIRGLGEMIRLLFKEAEVEFEDCRIESADWPQHKPKMPFGKMPVLYVDDKPLAHSRAIVRYLGREFKLDGGSSFEAALLDVWMETLFETFQNLPWEETDEEKRAKAMEAFMKDTAGPKLQKLEDHLKSHGGPYVLGKTFSMIDIVMLSVADLLTSKFQVKFDSYPSIEALLKAVRARPKIAAWIAKRPATMPFGKVPVLYVDGEPIAHSRAIVRFLAREHGLDGGSSLNAAKIDAWIENIFEMYSSLPWSAPNEEEKARLLAIWIAETMDPKISKLDAELAKCGGPYYLGQTVSALDFVVFTAMDFLKHKWEVDTTKYEAIAKLVEAVSKRPKIAAWIEKRPTTSF